jgi:hypothetical protein
MELPVQVEVLVAVDLVEGKPLEHLEPELLVLPTQVGLLVAEPLTLQPLLELLMVGQVELELSLETIPLVEVQVQEVVLKGNHLTQAVIAHHQELLGERMLRAAQDKTPKVDVISMSPLEEFLLALDRQLTKMFLSTNVIEKQPQKFLQKKKNVNLLKKT